MLVNMLRRNDDADAAIADFPVVEKASHATLAGADLASAVTEVFWNVLSPVAKPEDQDAPAHANFFDLGGDSVLAVVLVTEIERLVGLALSVTAIYEFPTVAGLVRLLTQPENVAASPIVQLREGDASPALFLIHGVGGSCIEQIGLARAVQTTAAVYGCQAHGLDGAGRPPECVEEMAELYLHDVRRIQPHGPYAFAGYSFGGLVAIEMARKARGAGQTVALLALLDTYPSMRTWPWAWKIEIWGRRLVYHIAQVRGMTVSAVPAYISARLRTLWRQLLGPARTERTFRLDPTAALTPTETVRQANAFARTWFVPRFYDGEIVFIQSGQTPNLPRRPARFWSKMAASLQVHVVPSDKPGLVREHAHAVALVLSGYLSAGREEAVASRRFSCGHVPEQPHD